MNQAAAATRLASARREPGASWWWLLPFAAALVYPWTLAQVHLAYSDGHGITARAALALLASFAIPALWLWLAWRLGVQQGAVGTAGPLRAARLAQLLIAALPLCTLLGVVLYLMKINGHDGAVWAGLWCTAALAAVLLTLVEADCGAAALPVTRGITWDELMQKKDR